MVVSFSYGRLGRVERGEDGLDGDAAAGDQLAAGAADGGGERRRPGVLEDEQRGGGAGLQRGAGLVEVVVGEQARGGALEDRELGDLVAEVGDLERRRPCRPRPWR